MIYEYRRYDCEAGYGPDLNQDFVDNTLPLWGRHGFRPIGFWETLLGSAYFRLHCLLAWDSLQDREERLAAVASDPGNKVGEREDGRPYVKNWMNQLWKPTSYCPQELSKSRNVIMEYRRYEIEPGYMAEMNEDFPGLTIPYFRKYGIRSFGYWEALVGNNNELHIMIEWDSMADREEKWAAFAVDPDRMTPLKDNGRPYIHTYDNHFWKPTSYSPVQ